MSHTPFIVEMPTKNHTVYYSKLPVTSEAFSLVQACSLGRQFMFVITATHQEAQELQEACQFFDPTLPCFMFPAWETLPYDQFSPHQEIVSDRLLTLSQLPQMQHGMVIASVSTVLSRLPPKSYLLGQVFSLRVGQKFLWDQMRTQLAIAGYHLVQQVALPGEYAVRGSLFDIFPTGADAPFRIDLFDEEIESIKQFDAETQRSIKPVQQIELLPAHEFPMNEAGIKTFRENFRALFSVNLAQCGVYESVSLGETPPGIEYYLPLFFDHTETIFNYLPEDAVLVVSDALPAQISYEWRTIQERYEQLSHDVRRPILPPAQLFIAQEEWNQKINAYAQWMWINAETASAKKVRAVQENPLQSLPELSMQAQAPQALQALLEFMTAHASKEAILFCAETTGRREQLLALLKPIVPRTLDIYPSHFNVRSPLPLARVCGSGVQAAVAAPRGEGMQESLSVFESASSSVMGIESCAGKTAAELGLAQASAVKGDGYINIVDTWHDFYQRAQMGAKGISIAVAPLQEGCILPGVFALIPESALLGRQVLQARRRKARHFDSDLVIRHLGELSVGDPIVHIDHGIGRYAGLEILCVGAEEGEFLKIIYEGGNLYVPVAAMHAISRYSGVDPEHAPLHRLGSDVWEKAKRKAAEQVRDVAAELLVIYAARAAKAGFQYPQPDEHYLAFAAGFAFEETPDQQNAIDAVIQDMTAPTPMDRLICGDVGFGKTEVAVRAAFLAVQAGKQVAILVPTTLLAQQHFESFSDRFADWPVKIGMLSRFCAAQEQKSTLAQLALGQVDIVIGTHKLLSNDVKFKELGLVVIDEEHRFGVRQKELLKKWRAQIDVLTMTATPIPRSLNMAMTAVRDLSIIATPPAKRLPIKTFVRAFDWPLIREAIQREILRGGQVYFLHNEVTNIERMADELRTLLPEARIEVAHGQLHERALERIMADFHHQRFNVLVCSTIIETGIDVPNANTIIINRADKFGLAQLHQLRGRVGRSHHQAYAYLLVPSLKTLTQDAQKRLEAIATFEELGVGFVLATHDLEIRGAGAFLGENQSGHIQAIGYTLYTELLARTVKAMQQGVLPDDLMGMLESSKECEVDLHIPAFIPDQYIPDVNNRLIFYKRIATASDLTALRELKVELIDRFGLLPVQVEHLFDQTQLKWLAAALGIKRIEANARGGRLMFVENNQLIDPVRMIELIQKRAKEFKLDGPHALKFFWPVDVEPTERAAAVEQCLRLLLR